jgi:hypothetical protein
MKNAIQHDSISSDDNSVIHVTCWETKQMPPAFSGSLYSYIQMSIGEKILETVAETKMMLFMPKLMSKLNAIANL